VRPSDGEEVRVTDSLAAGGTGTVPRKPVVLVADDDGHIRRLVVLLLQSRGMTIVQAADGVEALAVAKASRPDVLVLDVNMPGMSGFEVCRAIRSDPLLYRTPVLILTAQGATADKVAGFEVGADDYVQKPFEGAELAARVASLVARSRVYNAAEVTPPEPEGRVVAVVGAKGGSGTTTVTASLALVTADLWSGGALTPAALIDLDLVHSHAAFLLGVEPRRTLADLTAHVPLALDRDYLLQFAEQHGPGLAVLSGARNPLEGERITPDLVKALLTTCKGTFSYSYVDLPSSYVETSLSVFDLADLILVVVTPELTSMRSAVQLMAVFQSLSIPPERWHFLLNRPLDAGDLPEAALERTLHRPILQALPNNGLRVLEANNRGVPLVKSQPTQPFSIAIEELALRISHAVPVHSAAGGTPTERVGRIERRLKR
jgi:pilus assembly protein CpaE